MADCDNCGACCREQDSPPGYVAILAGIDWPDQDDVERVRMMPVELRDELRHYMDGRHTDGAPCLWHDAERRTCRHYE